MLQRALILLVLGLIQFGCGYKTDTLTPGELPESTRTRWETEKREFLKIEDLKVGTGPLAAWNRRIEADIEVRYVDGTLIYRGPTFFYAGFSNMPDTSVYDGISLPFSQEGIRLGLNGMAVGGKRRMTVSKELVCGQDATNGCHLVGPGNYGKSYYVRKEALIVEATLTKSCIPTRLSVFILSLFAWTGEVVCWDQDTPQVASSDPIWRFY